MARVIFLSPIPALLSPVRVAASFSLLTVGEEDTPLTDQPVGWQNPFGDVQAGNWFYADVQYVQENKLMEGTGATTFSAQLAVSRGMVATVLWRLAGAPTPAGQNPFSDLTQDWYRNAVIWAAEQSIVEGYGGGLFGPADNVTREQLAAMLYRYAKVAQLDTTATTDLSRYADAGTISTWALEALQWANASALINGRSATELAPAGTATRAELAAMLHRLHVK